MRAGVAALVAALALSGCTPAPVPEPLPMVSVVHVEESDPAVTGKCMGRYIRVEVPEVPPGTPDPDKFLQNYYDVYTRAFCEETKRLRTLEV